MLLGVCNFVGVLFIYTSISSTAPDGPAISVIYINIIHFNYFMKSCNLKPAAADELGICRTLFFGCRSCAGFQEFQLELGCKYYMLHTLIAS